jgi:hypothetical protein
MTRKLAARMGVALTLAIGLTFAGLAGAASADQPQPRPEQCGFYAGPIDAYYKHEPRDLVVMDWAAGSRPPCTCPGSAVRGWCPRAWLRCVSRPPAPP